jgi:hypothetical protein
MKEALIISDKRRIKMKKNIYSFIPAAVLVILFIYPCFLTTAQEAKFSVPDLKTHHINYIG